MPDGPVDFAIITALPVEKAAVLSRIDSPKRVTVEGEPLVFYYGLVRIPEGDAYSVIVTELLGMGNDEAAIATTRIIGRWRPRNILMVGIAGGVAGRVNLGDVVFSDYSYYYEEAKSTPAGDVRRPRQFPSDRLLYGRAKAIEPNEWSPAISVPRPLGVAEAALPTAHAGPIASGEKVIADRDALNVLLKDCPKLVAVGMEGAGVARAVAAEAGGIRFLEIRGVCDYADAAKADDWHRYAADAAAVFAVALLRLRPVAPLSAVPGAGFVVRVRVSFKNPVQAAKESELAWWHIDITNNDPSGKPSGPARIFLRLHQPGGIKELQLMWPTLEGPKEEIVLRPGETHLVPVVARSLIDGVLTGDPVRLPPFPLPAWVARVTDVNALIHRAEFTDLPPGLHRFTLRLSESSGEESVSGMYLLNVPDPGAGQDRFNLLTDMAPIAARLLVFAPKIHEPQPIDLPIRDREVTIGVRNDAASQTTNIKARLIVVEPEAVAGEFVLAPAFNLNPGEESRLCLLRYRVVKDGSAGAIAFGDTGPLQRDRERRYTIRLELTCAEGPPVVNAFVVETAGTLLSVNQLAE